MKCDFKGYRGWKCVIQGEHDVQTKDGYIPHGLVPRWWNWDKFARLYRKGSRR